VKMQGDLPAAHRKNLWITLLGIGMFLIGAAVVFSLPAMQSQALDDSTSSAQPVKVEYPAPGLTLADTQGNLVSLNDLSGMVVLVNNWATWCPPCRAEMPTLQAFYETYADEGFTIIAIDSGDPAGEVQAFIQDYGLTFPVWLDPDGLALEAFNSWSLPSSYVIDRDGIIRLMWLGAISRTALETHLAPLIRGD